MKRSVLLLNIIFGYFLSFSNRAHVKTEISRNNTNEKGHTRQLEISYIEPTSESIVTGSRYEETLLPYEITQDKDVNIARDEVKESLKLQRPTRRQKNRSK